LRPIAIKAPKPVIDWLKTGAAAYRRELSNAVG